MAIITLYTDDIAAKYESLKDSIQTSFDNKFSEAEWYCPMTYEGLREFIAESEDPDVAEWMVNTNQELYDAVEIEGIIDAVGSEYFYAGVELIPVDLFPDYLEEAMPAWGYHIPDFLVVDWKVVADVVADDYKIVTYQGQDYYFSA